MKGSLPSNRLHFSIAKDFSYVKPTQFFTADGRSVENSGRYPPPAVAPRLLRPLLQRRAGAAVPVFRHHRALLQPQHMARRRIPPPGRGAGALRRRRPPAGRDGGGGPVRPAGVLLRCRGPRERAGARQSLHGLLPAADAPCGPVCRRARLRLVHHDPLHQPPQGRQAHQRHRAGAGDRSSASGTCPPTSKSRTAICAACSSRRNTASTGRITAAASSAQRPAASR